VENFLVVTTPTNAKRVAMDGFAKLFDSSKGTA